MAFMKLITRARELNAGAHKEDKYLWLHVQVNKLFTVNKFTSYLNLTN